MEENIIKKLSQYLKSKNSSTKISSFGIGRKSKEEFFSNLSAMLSAGLSMSESLDILEEQSVGNFKKIIKVIKESVYAGRPLSQSMSFYPKVFTEFMVNTTSAGEASGELENSLGNISMQLRKEADLISTIRQAMFYPMIVLCLSFVMGMILSLWVLPKITPIFLGLRIDLPASTRFLIWFSKNVEKNSFFIIVSIFGTLFFAAWLVRQRWVKPITHYLFLHIPIIRNITRSKNLAQISRVFGTMLKSGVGIDETIRVTQSSATNFYYKSALVRIYQGIKQGSGLSESFGAEGKYFPKVALSMIKIGEKTGKLEEEFFHLADIYERRVDSDTKAISVAIEPLLLIFIGLIVGGLAISIISPIYQITGNIYN